MSEHCSMAVSPPMAFWGPIVSSAHAPMAADILEKLTAIVKDVYATDRHRDQRLVRRIASEDGNGRYGLSWMYLSQATDTRALRGSEYGYIHRTKDTFAGIGLFARPYRTGRPDLHFHVVAPAGRWTSHSIAALCKSLHDISGTAVYLKKTTTDQRHSWQLADGRFRGAEDLPWHHEAPFEDDTHPEVILNLDTTLALLESASQDNELRRKFRRFHRDFANRIERVPYRLELRSAALEIVNGFFAEKSTSLSTPQNYYSMIDTLPAGANGIDYFSSVYTLDGRPVALFMADSIGKGQVGIYANLTANRELAYLSEYFQLREFRALLNAGMTTVNLGGAETLGLQSFKMKFRPASVVQNDWLTFRG